jgi:hypothetical protein
MEESATPWLIAEATVASGASPLWAWLTLLSGAAAVLAGGILIAVI